MGNLPLGIDRSAVEYSGNPPYQKILAALPHTIRDNDDVEDGLALYLRLLAEADGPAELLEIGCPQVLAALCAHTVILPKRFPACG